MANKIVAIIGRPNVGKSTLFNRLIGKRLAIVHDTPGVTRDRNYGEAEWNGKKFFLIDTGGYVPNSKDKFEAAIREQVQISIDEADVILYVVDAQTGVTPLDFELASLLRKEMNKEINAGKKLFLVANKVDSHNFEIYLPDFYKLGLGEPLDVSAMVGRKSGDLLDLVAENIPDDVKDEFGKDEIPKFAIIGRPNVGKSSLSNALTQTNRNIVTDIPGTTRDSIDSTIKYYGQDIVLIDTAGLRRKAKIRKAENLEFYSAIRTRRSIEKCDVAIVVIDAATIVTKLSNSSDIKLATFKLDKEDVNIISEAAQMKKGILIVINKWDLVEKDSETAKLFEIKIKEHIKTFDYLPFLFISALTKQRISRVIEDALKVYKERAREIKTSELNARLQKVIEVSPPFSRFRREIKINYITQLKASPPVIGFFANNPSDIEENYKRFLEGKIREFFGFDGVPLTLVFKKKN
ncbi:MAG: ribosome biogenesis GTPase Der [Ignavibacteriae bacterium]|nr:MAG: ribosome biogenesis GTPase Der [Ignavibacteriota bacterium]